MSYHAHALGGAAAEAHIEKVPGRSSHVIEHFRLGIEFMHSLMHICSYASVQGLSAMPCVNALLSKATASMPLYMLFAHFTYEKMHG